jgi:hypothetical protein
MNTLSGFNKFNILGQLLNGIGHHLQQIIRLLKGFNLTKILSLKHLLIEEKNK